MAKTIDRAVTAWPKESRWRYHNPGKRGHGETCLVRSHLIDIERPERVSHIKLHFDGAVFPHVVTSSQMSKYYLRIQTGPPMMRPDPFGDEDDDAPAAMPRKKPEPPKSLLPVVLQYWSGVQWVDVGTFASEGIAWTSLGEDTDGYRVIDAHGKELSSNPPRSTS